MIFISWTIIQTGPAIRRLPRPSLTRSAKNNTGGGKNGNIERYLAFFERTEEMVACAHDFCALPDWSSDRLGRHCHRALYLYPLLGAPYGQVGNDKNAQYSYPCLSGSLLFFPVAMAP